MNNLNQNAIQLLTSATPIIGLYSKVSEYFQAETDVANPSPQENDEDKKNKKINLGMLTLISFLVPVLAAYLAWMCSTKKPVLFRILFALVAFLFAPLYLIIYFIFLRGCCAKQQGKQEMIDLFKAYGSSALKASP